MVTEFAAAISAILALLIPFSVLSVRDSIKKRRQEVILEFQRVFINRIPGSDDVKIFPSFEFVKYKYSITPEGNKPIKEQDPDFKPWQFAIAALPLALVLGLFGFVSFGLMLHALFPKSQSWIFSEIDGDKIARISVWIAAYFGSYVHVLRSLLRSVENFELTPVSFLDSSGHVIFGAIFSMIIVLSADAIFPVQSTAALFSSVLLLSAFTIGMIPELGIRTILRYGWLSTYKREAYGLYERFTSTPLEVIDGIDFSVKTRLSRYNIESVQHLATANPIALFVETPYGIYEVIDWIAQAQLCCAVGPERLGRLQVYGIRTIFDLERAILDKKVGSPKTRNLIGAVLFRDNAHDALNFADASEAAVSLTQTATDELHVHRLRQIWLHIQKYLGLSSSAFSNNRATGPVAIQSNLSVSEAKAGI